MRNTISLDTISLRNDKKEFATRENEILARIQKHYSQKLGREITHQETKEIADGLLGFIKSVYESY